MTVYVKQELSEIGAVEEKMCVFIVTVLVVTAPHTVQ